MKTFKAVLVMSLGLGAGTSFAQTPGVGGAPMQAGGQMQGAGQMQLGAQMQMGGPGQMMLPGPGGQIPMMQPQGARMAYQPTMVGEQPPAPGGCGMGRNDYSRIVNQGGAPMPLVDGGSHN